MDKEIIQPKELWQRLLEADPGKISRVSVPDIDMIAQTFRLYSTLEHNLKTKELFSFAINNWEDAQVVEFVNMLTEFEYDGSQSVSNFRDGLKQVYKKIFE